MQPIKVWFKWRSEFFYPIIILIVNLLLITSNYSPNTWLSGGDVLHPEFNFKLNLMRSIFGVWQSGFGLGVLGGMSHSSDIVRQLILWILSVIVPSSLLRYLWQFSMLLLGQLGVYKFITGYLLDSSKDDFSFSTHVRGLIGLAGALFYLMNLGTVQNFFMPIEMFTTQYGFLPWLFYFVALYLKSEKPKYLLLFAVATVLSATQAYTGTLFIAYLLFLVLFVFLHVRYEKQFLKEDLLKAWRVLSTGVVLNLFWILPLVYFVTTKSHVVEDASINRLSSEESFLLNKKFGSFDNVIQLRGFWFDNTDYNVRAGKFFPLFDPWKTYQSKEFVSIVGLAISISLLIGLVYAVLISKYRAYSLLFILCLFFLMNENPPLGALFTWIRDNIPLVKEALRFPYTKFSVIFIFISSILFSLFFKFLYELRVFNRLWSKVSISVVYMALMVVWFFPAFQGNLIYKDARVAIPSDYFALFNWLEAQPHDKRILHLPFDNVWGWPRYKWGYRGSGFLWYGVKQPILDRAFDVWGSSNEAAYRELSYLFYSRNYSDFESALDKYQVSYLLFDKNIFIPLAQNPNQLGSEYFNEFISQTKDVTLAAQFGDLFLYEYQVKKFSWESAKRQVRTIAPLQHWTNKDTNYAGGDYFMGNIENFDAYSPFVNFDDPLNKDAMSVSLNDDKVSLLAQIKGLQNNNLSIVVPAISTMDSIKVHVKAQKTVAGIKFILMPERYDLKVNSVSVEPDLPPYEFTLNLDEDSAGYFVTLDDIHIGELIPTSVETDFGFHIVSPRTAISIKIFGKEGFNEYKITSATPVSNLDVCEDTGGDSGSYSIEKQGNTLTLRGKNVPACYIPSVSDFDTKGGLVSLNLFYETSESFPAYCIYDEVSASCLNDINSHRSSVPAGSLYDFFVVNNNNPISLVLYAKPLKNNYSYELFAKYTNLTLRSYPLISEVSVVIPSLGEVVSSLASINESVISEIEFSYPIVPSSKRTYYREDFNTYRVNSPTGDCSGKENTEILKLVSQGSLIMYANASAACEYFPMSGLDPKLSYLLSVRHKRVSGKNQDICIFNTESSRCDVLEKLYDSNNGDWTTSVLIVPSKMLTEGETIALRVSALAIDTPAEIWIDSIKMVTVPYDFVKGIKIVRSTQDKTYYTFYDIHAISKRLANFLYISSDKISDNSVLLLNESYDKGWFLFCGWGGCASRAELLNGWQMSWKLTKGSNGFMVLYMPQILSILAILVGFVAFIRLYNKWRHG